jgi:hypothetical protein
MDMCRFIAILTELLLQFIYSVFQKIVTVTFSKAINSIWVKQTLEAKKRKFIIIVKKIRNGKSMVCENA